MRNKGMHYEDGEIARQKIVEFVYNYVKDHGYSPTFREIMAEADFSTLSMVHFHVNRLVDMECITYVPYTSRTIQVTQKGVDKYVPADQLEA